MDSHSQLVYDETPKTPTRQKSRSARTVGGASRGENGGKLFDALPKIGMKADSISIPFRSISSIPQPTRPLPELTEKENIGSGTRVVVAAAHLSNSYYLALEGVPTNASSTITHVHAVYLAC